LALDVGLAVVTGEEVDEAVEPWDSAVM
jgi:hypothetical protein